MLIKHNDEMTIDKIVEMDKDSLQEAVIRMLSVKPVRFINGLGGYNGEVYLPDDLADAFRGRE